MKRLFYGSGPLPYPLEHAFDVASNVSGTVAFAVWIATVMLGVTGLQAATLAFWCTIVGASLMGLALAFLILSHCNLAAVRFVFLTVIITAIVFALHACFL